MTASKIWNIIDRVDYELESKECLQFANLPHVRQTKTYTLPKTIKIGIDAEWDDVMGVISLQLCIKNNSQNVLFLNPKTKEFGSHYELLEYCKINDYKIVYHNFDEETNIIDNYLQSVYPDMKKGSNVDLFCFYSPRDLIIGFGYNNLKEPMERGLKNMTSTSFLDQKRQLLGNLRYHFNYRVVDLHGWTGSGVKGLGGLASSLGIPMEYKQSFDNYKSNMSKALELYPVEFVKYGFGDVFVLFDIFKTKIKQHNSLLKEVFNLREEFFLKEREFPLTVGSLVFKTYMTVFLQKIMDSKNPERFVLAFCKLSILNVNNKNYDKLLENFNKYIKNPVEHLREIKSNLLPSLKEILFNYKVFEFTPLNSASIPYFLTSDMKLTTPLNALVTGGRTNNERPESLSLDYAADIDLKSCYGTALTNFIHPLGIPTIVSKTPNEKFLTLKEFLNQYEDELLPNLWKITVTGPLKYAQDLVYSKMVSSKTITSFYNKELKFGGDFDNLDHLYSKIGLIRNEIENGVITHDILEIIRKVCSNDELKDFYNLQVVTAVFWKKSDMMSDIDEWSQYIMHNDSKMEYCATIQNYKDLRSRKWIPPSISKLRVA